MKLKLAAAYVISGVFFTGCPDKESTPPDAGVIEALDAALADAAEPIDAGLPPPEVCPRGSGEPVLGDMNGDGVLDVADPIALQNNLFRASREVVCRRAADWNDDGRVEADDASRVTTYLITGAQQARTLNAAACQSADFWPEGQCAPLALDLHAPERVTTGSFNATLAIRSPTLAIQGWSLSLRAEGCRIADVSTENTTAAEVWDDPPGIRHLGYDASKVLGDEGAISFVILSTVEDVVLPASSSIATFEVRASLPATGCTECRVFAGDGLTWLGQPIDTVIVSDGYAYRPEAPSVVVQVCAP